ncbi:hypothetical protein ES319_D01G174900v1 [Gossypium barbadense]|uniref:Uncharacterized protein n=2 Tax=Gossypium TaxID=3633 RepID=A0A5J5SVK8_GOSBA|nr:hypothetical protein ES319_D01G174900v1 [Gossypium barbadense]TYG83691.1 hypothetical protein ES288_D01G188900v1 [Gossypium darwinii]
MEATRKRGFSKGKLAKSLSRVTKVVVPCPPPSIPRVSKYSYAAISKHQPSRFHEHDYHNSLPFDALGDENVDSKATSFISNVREGFKLDRN